MGKTTVWVGVVLGMSACVPPKTAAEEQAERRAEYEAANRERDAYAQRSRQAARERDEERRARLEAEDAARARVRAEREATRTAQKAAAQSSMCDETRSARIDEMKKRVASIQKKADLEEWEAAHCKYVDRSKSVVRLTQDSRGEYHVREGRDRGVDRECDAKKPPELAGVYARDLTVYRIPSGPVNDSVSPCREADLSKAESAETARAYWTEACIGWSRHGKQAPGFCDKLLEGTSSD